jgi:hypothetical protein
VIPIDGDIGFIFHIIEFLSVLVGVQLLIAPIMVRIMFPSAEDQAPKANSAPRPS